ncbi:hypothetical protein EVAR_32116_1 [Eumeta japonica]|uniref:Uncharacterized protein n=1 Tax=Eumeta variegata TaxID=151549 RepID=A0A4C1V486_EUMVA|nr:hypothetical protein EVAR_32116_1 [Eumeta japonica]
MGGCVEDVWMSYFSYNPLSFNRRSHGDDSTLHPFRVAIRQAVKSYFRTNARAHVEIRGAENGTEKYRMHTISCAPVSH